MKQYPSSFAKIGKNPGPVFQYRKISAKPGKFRRRRIFAVPPDRTAGRKGKDIGAQTGEGLAMPLRIANDSANAAIRIRQYPEV